LKKESELDCFSSIPLSLLRLSLPIDLASFTMTLPFSSSLFRPNIIVTALVGFIVACSLVPANVADSSVSAPLRAVQAKVNEAVMKHAEYIIIIDAGSSGSRVHVHPFVRQEPMPLIKPSTTMKITPGLSSYEFTPKEGGQSLVQLLDFAKENIPEAHWASTPIHLKATAGLRSIPLDAAAEILVECRKVIRKYPFHFKDEWALIISGQQEGIFGWVSANYLEGFLGIPNKRTVGVIEMGGASMQITFVPDVVPPEVKHRVTPVTIGSQTYSVYTHSYLNYGLDAVQRLFHTTHKPHLTKSGHPCYPKSYKHPHHGLTGTGDHEQCSNLMDSLFTKENCTVPSEMCTWNGIAQPPISTEKFYAIENYFYTSSFFGVHEESDPWARLEHKGKEYCSKSWDSIASQWEKENKDDLAKYCFSSVYLTKVLKRGFGLESPNKHAHIRSKINGAKIDWALGAVLYELMAEAHKPLAPTTVAVSVSGDDDSEDSIMETATAAAKLSEEPSVEANESESESAEVIENIPPTKSKRVIEDTKPLLETSRVSEASSRTSHTGPLTSDSESTAPKDTGLKSNSDVAAPLSSAPSVPETPAHLKNPPAIPSSRDPEFPEEQQANTAASTTGLHSLIDSYPAMVVEPPLSHHADILDNDVYLVAGGIMMSAVLLYAYVAVKKKNPFFLLSAFGARSVSSSTRRRDIFLDEIKFSV
jgi:apyrase